jgi:hypothetical protein
MVTLGLAGAATVLWALTVGKWMGGRDAVARCVHRVVQRGRAVAAGQEERRKLAAGRDRRRNSVAVVSDWSVELAFTALLYAIYLRLGVLGWIQGALGDECRRVPSQAMEHRAQTRGDVRHRQFMAGKTTLARKLSAHFGEPVVPEFVREFWDAHGGAIDGGRPRGDRPRNRWRTRSGRWPGPGGWCSSTRIC